MLICPACQHQNVDGTQFCEMCGEELPAASVAATSLTAMTTCPQCAHENPADNLACEACGADLKPGAPDAVADTSPFVNQGEDDIFSGPDTGLAPPLGAPAAPPLDVPAAPPVAATSTLLDSTPTESTPFDSASFDTAPAATTPLPAGDLMPGNVKLVVEQGQSVGAQFVLGDPELLVGREDEEEEIYPDIDLSDQDAGYVHRKHATLSFDNGNLSVTHLGGSNKTRINNKPVPDNVPTPVKLGDKIAFGKVVLRLLPA